MMSRPLVIGLYIFAGVDHFLPNFKWRYNDLSRPVGKQKLRRRNIVNDIKLGPLFFPRMNPP